MKNSLVGCERIKCILIYFFALIGLALTCDASEILNKYPHFSFAKQILDSDAWLPSFEDETSEDYKDLSDFINFISNKPKADALARKVLENKNTYKFKYRFLKFLQSSPSDLAMYPGLENLLRSDSKSVWQQIPKIYLNALILMIEGSPVKDYYQPIIKTLKQMIEARSFSFVDLTESIRQEWATSTNGQHVANRSTTMTKNSKGQYTVNGAFNSSTKVFAMDLSLSRDENLVTFAHEIVHIADPELFAAREQLNTHFTNLTKKMRVLFPNGNIEAFLSALVKEVFLEQGRTDIASIPLTAESKTTSFKGSNTEQERYTDLAEEIASAGYNHLLTDEDFKGFLSNLIKVSVENEYKAYILSYALYCSLREINKNIMPPSQERDEFIQKHFDHPSKLQDILQGEAKPFSKGSALGHLIPGLSLLTEEQRQSPEISETLKLTNVIKKVVQTLYFKESRLMIERTTEKFALIYQMISRSLKTANDEDEKTNSTPTRSEEVTTSGTPASEFYRRNPFLKKGGYYSLSNPYMLAEAKLGTAAIIRFRENIEGLKKSLTGIHDSLLTMMARILPLNNLNFGELKWIGLLNTTDNVNKAMPPTCKPHDLSDIDPNDAESFTIFGRFVWNKSLDTTSRYIKYDDARDQVFVMQLFKATLWLRNEFPLTEENIEALRMFKNKLIQREFDLTDISETRAEELLKEISGYFDLIRPRHDDLKNIDFLVHALAEISTAIRRFNLKNLTDEFNNHINLANKYFEYYGLNTETSLEQIEQGIHQSIANFSNDVRSFAVAKGCDKQDDLYWNRAPISFSFGPNRKIENLTFFCHHKKVYVLRLPCDWSGGSTTSTTDPNGLTTEIFNGARRLIMSPIVEF